MGAKPSAYFKAALASAKETFRSNLPNAMDRVDAEMSSKGKLISGAHIKRVEQALVEEFEIFAETILAKISKFEYEHTPIKNSDFALAAEAIDQGKQECEIAFNNRIITKYAHYPATRPQFDDGALDRAHSKSRADLEGLKHEFASSKSFWKWALGDMRKRLWSGFLLFIGAGLSSLLSWVFALAR